MKKILITIAASVFSLLLFSQSYRGDAKQNYLQALNDEYATGMFKAAEGTILDLTDETNTAVSYTNILDWMQGRVAGLQVYTLRGGTRVPYIRGSQARIYVDEIPISASFLNSLPVFDIAMVKVIKGPFAGSLGNSAVISIYTLKPGDEEEED
jgi:hypothetical protein